MKWGDKLVVNLYLNLSNILGIIFGFIADSYAGGTIISYNQTDYIGPHLGIFRWAIITTIFFSILRVNKIIFKGLQSYLFLKYMYGFVYMFILTALTQHLFQFLRLTREKIRPDSVR